MLELDRAKTFYETLPERVRNVRSKLGRPLTMTEKVLYSHLEDIGGQAIERGKSFLMLNPDRVAMQDATAQMAILQFISSGRKAVAVPTTVHCDHLIRAQKGVDQDMAVALKENKEVFEFLSSAARNYGMGFWKPGAGIIHQVVLENYAFPGGLMIGTDSHTPNAGGMGMLAVGVGGADAVDVMVGMPWELLCPKLVGVRLTGKLSGWTSGKDVILKMLELLTCAGGTNKIIEYFGPGVGSISLTGRGTVTNMGAELGATTSVFPCDERTAAYLRATRRKDVAEWALANRASINADAEVHKDPKKYYDEFIEIDLDKLKPRITGPHTPDKVRPVSQMQSDIEKEGYPQELKVGLIGSCTNSSYEDIGRAAHVARQALAKGLKSKVPLLITPGSDQVYDTLERDGLLKPLREIGGTILANACGPCIGQWKREDVQMDAPKAGDQGEGTAIVTSFNRNFRGRNDGLKQTLAFITSPELVVAMSLSGKLGFDPERDAVNGGGVKLEAPYSDDMPAKGYQFNDSGFQAPAAKGGGAVAVKSGSDRLQLLEPFAPWEGSDLSGLRVLVKAQGKCTTDHISAAGKWLTYRGHLDNISNNLFLGAVNAFTGETGAGTNQRNGEKGKSFPEIARDYKAHGIGWVAFGDHNYGEGSSREHAALEPRHLGGRAVIVRSFARIHETNLKKQGMLALTFANPADYDKVRESDTVAITGLKTFAPGKPLTVTLTHADGSSESFPVKHSYNAEQIAWFKAGSALNIIRKNFSAAAGAVSAGKAAAKPKAIKKKAKPAAKKAVATKKKGGTDTKKRRKPIGNGAQRGKKGRSLNAKAAARARSYKSKPKGKTAKVLPRGKKTPSTVKRSRYKR